MAQRIHKATMLREVRTTKAFRGYVTPNNVNSLHVTGGWRLGVNVLITQGRDEKFYIVNEHFNLEPNPLYEPFAELEDWITDYKHWNCVKELGRRVQFWE